MTVFHSECTGGEYFFFGLHQLCYSYCVTIILNFSDLLEDRFALNLGKSLDESPKGNNAQQHQKILFKSVLMIAANDLILGIVLVVNLAQLVFLLFIVMGLYTR